MADTLPCGCVMDTVGETFVYQPCSPGCTYWLYVQEQSKTIDRPLVYIVDPEIEDLR